MLIVQVLEPPELYSLRLALVMRDGHGARDKCPIETVRILQAAMSKSAAARVSCFLLSLSCRLPSPCATDAWTWMKSIVSAGCQTFATGWWSCTRVR